ncbi:nucleoside kinase [Terrisporobacter mayombei]|uniref:Uridine kinase n=1 Tax=Terrisporobacter mayombei TaxID=1541 RepID=A0ABY9Q2T3_9FIRM|nr:nucleoside kinase [Terrisporobacter mayombei]MCC3869462.1 nucleoside kinase [Terrisporobacter mayombei]WMT82293.1 Uridine kinase [Terrisporobacter mayombei]
MKQLNLTIEDEEKKILIEDNSTGIKLEDIACEIEENYTGYIALASINNKLKELTTLVSDDCNIKFLDTNNTDGYRVYSRSLTLVFIMACEELYENCKVSIEHSLSNGLYCEVSTDTTLNEKDREAIKLKMQEIIDEDYKIEKTIVTKKEAINFFDKHNKKNKAELLKYKEHDDIKIYKCNNHVEHFYGHMLPSTGYLKTFDVLKYGSGFILLGPREEEKFKVREFIPQPKLSNIYLEMENWSKLMGVDTVLSLNKIVENGTYGELIRIVEALQEKKLGQIADIIKQENKRIILIAAPSSSGKTSFAHRLSIHLKVNNLQPISISLDDYFVDRDKTPLDEFGNYDFESIYAINLDRFNKDLSDLLEGKEVTIPRFNFKKGISEEGKKLKIEKNQPIILEGIHGLNPILTSSIPDKEKFKIYLSVLTQLNLDEHNRIPTTDLRLIRRIVRDNQFRGHNATRTILTWDSVRRGEKQNIFPYQEESDMIFNSSCVYELAILKAYVKPLLEEIDSSSKAYSEANRLLKFLQYFVELKDTSDLPPTSIIREFIGGSKIVD